MLSSPVFIAACCFVVVVVFGPLLTRDPNTILAWRPRDVCNYHGQRYLIRSSPGYLRVYFPYLANRHWFPMVILAVVPLNHALWVPFGIWYMGEHVPMEYSMREEAEQAVRAYLRNRMMHDPRTPGPLKAVLVREQIPSP